MKILVLAAYSYFKGHKGFEKNNSGFAYAVSDTCRALTSCGNQVFLLTQSGITNGFYFDGVCIIKKKWLDILFSFYPKDIINGIIAIKGSNATLIDKLKTIYYYLNRGYVERVIRNIKPDVIQIQSVSNYTLPYMLAASKLKVPYIVSNHGLATFLKDTDMKLKQVEKDFFKYANQEGTIVTTVSTGIKTRLKKTFNINGNNIYVIPNGFIPNNNDKNIITLRNTLGINSKDFVFICVGSISARKNQMQVCKAFKKLLKDYDDVSLLFAGDGPQFKQLQNYVEANRLYDKVKLLGNVEHDKMSNYYNISNATVLASIDEGFGLPVIEGYSYGLPSILYGDLDAAADLSFDEATIVVNDRGVVNLANGMRQAIQKKWDKNLIINCSRNFSNHEMGIRYQAVLKKGIKTNSKMSIDYIMRIIKGRK